MVRGALSFLPFPTRNPSLTGSGRWTDTYWPLHTPLKREILTLSAEPSKILEGHRVRKCAFWKKFLPQLGMLYSETDNYANNDNLTFPQLNTPLCATRKDILPVSQDMMVLHTAAFGLFIIAFVLLVVKISFMVTSVVIKACSNQPRMPQPRPSEMTVVSGY